MNFIQRWNTALGNTAEKARKPNQIAPHISRDVISTTNMSWDQYWKTKDDVEKQRIMLRISWIYSAVDLIARQSASTPLKVKRTKKGEKKVDIDNHPFEVLMKSPNPFMTKTFLLRYLIYGLEMSRNGAFWYLAPDRTTKQLAEIWPINPTQITVVPSPTQFVDYYLYTPLNTSERAYKIDPKYIAWFRYPDPFDYWGSLPPFLAAMLPAEIEMGIQGQQAKFYSESRGVPLSLVSLDPDLSDSDFETARTDIKEDWSSGATIAIARAGDIDVKSLGFTQKDLEIIGNQELTRDKLDSIFFGYPIRSDSAFDGDGIKEADRLVNEKTIFPLLTLISEQITKDIIIPFYDAEFIAEFDDVRTADRSLNIQENQLASRWQTMNEMRAKGGEAPMVVPRLDGIGDLPVWLATNPSFVSTYYQLMPSAPQGSGNGIDGGNIEAFPEAGNLTDSAAPEATINRLASSAAEKMAIQSDLKRWKTVAKRAQKNGDKRPFVSGVIPNTLVDRIELELIKARTPEAIDTLFGKVRDEIEAIEL